MNAKINKRDIPGANGTGQLQLLINNSILNKVNTSLIGRIEKFYPDTQTCDVQPIQPERIIDIGTEVITYSDIPSKILPNVPVIFPSGGGFSLTFPVKKDDECLIVFNQRPIYDWQISSEGGLMEDGGIKDYSVNNALVLVGINSGESVKNALPNINPDFPEIRKNDGSVAMRVTDDGIEVDGDLAVDGDITVTGDIESQGSIKAPNGDVTAGTISLKNHTHPSGIAVSVTGTATAQTGATTAPTAPPT